MKKPVMEEEQQKKVVTRYEQKMEKRKAQQEKEARNDKVFKWTCLAVGCLLVVVIVGGIAMSAVNKNKVTKDTYIKIGEHEITKLEYNYYYNMTVNNYINTYSSVLSYMGLDPNVSYAEQTYSEDMSWKDAFDQMAVAQITQIKAMTDDAKANGFSPDLTEEYKELQTNIAAAAKTGNMNLSQYYKNGFGSYATEANVEAFARENLLTEAYYNDLMEQNAPTAEAITSYYEENKDNYDKVSYRSYTFNSALEEGASEEQIAEAMELLKANAEEMAARREAGMDFKELCLEYATEENKETYENAETDASLTENASFASTSTMYQSWLYDESRTAGDITVIEDESSNRYYVVEFVERTYDETTEETISNSLAGEIVNEYITTLTENYEVTDLTGDLVYLTIEDAVEETEASEETETTEAETIEADGENAEAEAGQ